MMGAGHWALGFGLTAGVLAGACSPLGCTDMGCGSHLVVHVEGVEMTEESTLTLQVEGGESVLMDCYGNMCALEHIDWNDRYPQVVTLTLALADTSITRTFAPRYREYYPNGRGCGECRGAELTFSVE